jgi:predicted DCC family thiol-disulfide oxidoreductase YuxK
MRDAAMTARVTVWYDSQCPLCVREIALMRRLDRHGAIEFLDLYTTEDCPLDRQLLLERFHARERDGTVVSGARAFAAMWRALPPLRPLGLIARLPPALWVLEGLYRLFLLARPGLQRTVKRLERKAA